MRWQSSHQAMLKIKKNQKISNVSSVMVTTQPTTKDAQSTKTYRRETSHRYEANKTGKKHKVLLQKQTTPHIS
jgi:hypothetical protein